jgi:F0F1-type ATP synthase epsilon subunit
MSEKTQQSSQNHLELVCINEEGQTSQTISWIELVAPNGSFIVGPGHVPMVSIIKPDTPLAYSTSGGQESSLDISGGFAIVEDNKITIIHSQKHSAPS